MNRVVRHLLILIILQLPQLLKSQDKPFFAFTEEDGLANNDVYDLTTDGRGYLWIATKDGLSKYTAETFRNFRIAQGLPSNNVRAVAHDEKNNIYAGCFLAGLAVLYNNVVIRTLHISAPLNDTYRRLFYSERHHILFIGTDYGIYALKDSTLFKFAEPNYQNTKSSIISITEFEGIIYFTVQSPNDQGGLFKIEVDKKYISASKVTKIIGGSSAYGCTVIDKTIFVNLNWRIYSFTPNTGKVAEFARTTNHFIPWSMCQMAPHKLGLGGWAESVYIPGIQVLDILTQKQSPCPYNLRSPSINNIIYDPDTRLNWVCSDIGLYCLYDSPFEIYTNIDEVRIKDIEIQNDSLYVLNDNHVWKIEKGKWKLLFNRKQLEDIISRKQISYLSNKGNRKFSRTDLSRQLNEGKAGTLVDFCHDGNQLFLKTTKGTVSIPDLKTYLPITKGKFITENKNRTLWILSNQSFRYFPSVKDSIDNLPLESTSGNPFKNIQKIIKNGNMFYCISGINGLYVIKGNDILYLNSENSRFDNSITDIDTDSNGEVWCTSASGNLFHLGFGNKPFIIKTFNLSNTRITGDNYKWLKFNNRFLYVGTNKGLNKIPSGQLDSAKIDTVFYYNKYNGYDFTSANSPVCDSQGNLYVSTPEKIIKIKNERTILPKLKIIFPNIWINDHHVTFQQLTGKSLPHTTRDITISFSVIKLPNSRNMEYHYKLNNNWWENGNSIVLQSLKPGKYNIECEAIDRETSLNYHDSFSFQIDQPFWFSWWFSLIIVSAIVMLIYWILNLRFTRKKRENNEKSKLTMEIAELHIQSLQSQMNPHFIFNSLNSIQSFILSNNMLDAATYLGTLGSIIRMNLENVSEEYISLPEEIRFLEKYIEIEKMRFKDSLNITISNKVYDSDKILLPPMLIQPLIENSIKHGLRYSKKTGRIDIEFYLDEALLKVTVTDNGIGRTESGLNDNSTHLSLGLNLICKRLNLMNEKNETKKFGLYITDLFDDGSAVGTKVCITIPQKAQNDLTLKISKN